METKRSTESRKKKSFFNLKYLLAIIFAVAFVAVCGVIIGIMYTSNAAKQSDSGTESSTEDAASHQVEVWAPQGVSVPAGTVIDVVDSATVLDSAQTVQTSSSDDMSDEDVDTETAQAAADKPVVHNTIKKDVVKVAKEDVQVTDKPTDTPEQEQHTGLPTQNRPVMPEERKRDDRNTNVEEMRIPVEVGPSKPQKLVPVEPQTPSVPRESLPIKEERPAAKVPQSSIPQPVKQNDTAPITDNLF